MASHVLHVGSHSFHEAYVPKVSIIILPGSNLSSFIYF